jgi:hypothetical protein
MCRTRNDHALDHAAGGVQVRPQRRTGAGVGRAADGETDGLANTANAAAAIYHALPDLNWAGFYFVRGHELVLGPFRGRPACSRIPLGEGVCGTAAARRRSVLVVDLEAFPVHIARDKLPAYRQGQPLRNVIDCHRGN